MPSALHTCSLLMHCSRAAMALAHGPVTVPWHSVDSTKMAGSFGHLLRQLNVAVPPPPLPPPELQAASVRVARDAAVHAPLARVGRVRPLIARVYSGD